MSSQLASALNEMDSLRQDRQEVFDMLRDFKAKGDSHYSIGRLT